MKTDTIESACKGYETELIDFAVKAVQTRSYSDEEENMALLVKSKMEALGYDQVFIDSVGNVVGRIGSGKKIAHFDSHMDTVQVNDADEWVQPPFAGNIVNGRLYGRGSVDMKGGLCASVYAAAAAKKAGLLTDKTVYVTATVCEEYCDGVNLKCFFAEHPVWPDFCIICEPSGNLITLGHTGKVQTRIKTHGVSAHGSAPEKGVNAVYEMAEIITRVDALNQKLTAAGKPHGTIVLSDISCVSASLNAVPSECSIYLDRRLVLGETTNQVFKEMDELIKGKDAEWEIGTLTHTSWKVGSLVYEPVHDPWKIEQSHPLTLACDSAYETVFGAKPDKYDFWDFGTNAITPVGMGIPTIGFGPGEYKLAHMRNENCEVKQIKDACRFYTEVITML